MATTLVIKNANFAANKIDTVEFSAIPCTGVSLSDSTASLSNIGETKTLMATVTPANTTDVLQWSSSNNNVVSVVNGVVTAVGLGSATVTATCGNFSASCAFEVSLEFNPYWYVGGQVLSQQTSSPVKRYATINPLSSAIASGSLTGTYPYNGTEDPYVYPYPIPDGCTKIRVQASGYYLGVTWSNLSQTEYNNKAIGLGGNNASSSSGIADDYTYIVPDGVDSFGLTIRRKNDASASAADAQNVSVTFLVE